MIEVRDSLNKPLAEFNGESLQRYPNKRLSLDDADGRALMALLGHGYGDKVFSLVLQDGAVISGCTFDGSAVELDDVGPQATSRGTHWINHL